MFHTYVTASSGRKVDIDRARFLMDQELFNQVHLEVIKWVRPTGFNPFDIAVAERMGETTELKAQRVWAGYCRAHLARYGTPFERDVAENWDA